MCADSASGAAEGVLGTPSAHGLELDKDIFVHTIIVVYVPKELNICRFSSLRVSVLSLND